MAFDKNWRLASTFELYQAAFLWAENEPPTQSPKSFAAIEETSVRVIAQTLVSAAERGRLKARYSEGSSWMLEAAVTREELVRYAAEKGEVPTFLKSPSFQPATRNVGGRPQKHDWEAFYAFVAYEADIHGLPAKQSELVKKAQEYFQKQGQDEPAESLIKERVSKIYDVLKKLGRKPNNA